MRFEVKKCYRTRDGRKATIYLIRPGYMIGEIEGDNNQIPWKWNTGGRWNDEPYTSGLDLVSEWREPVRVIVGLVRNRNGELDLIEIDSELYLKHKQENGWQLIARREIVEGEGME